MPREPDLERFDWSAEEHATSHGVSIFEIEDAFFDPKAVYITPSRRNRFGETRSSDGRTELLARALPHGPYLHIVFVIEGGMIRLFHAREMDSDERNRYGRNKR